MRCLTVMTSSSHQVSKLCACAVFIPVSNNIKIIKIYQEIRDYYSRHGVNLHIPLPLAVARVGYGSTCELGLVKIFQFCAGIG